MDDNKRYALIEASEVVNMVAWDGVTPIGKLDLSKLVSVTDHPQVSIGWGYVDGEFIPPAEDDLPMIEVDNSAHVRNETARIEALEVQVAQLLKLLDK